MKAQRASTLSPTSVLNGMGGERHVTTALLAGKRPGIHCIGGWAGPNACMDRWEKSRPPPPEFDPWTVQPVARDGIPQLN